MAKEEKKAEAAPAPALEPGIEVKPAGVWLAAVRGDVYVDGAGKEHAIHGVVTEGFDAICEGKPENFRLPSPDSTVAAVNAWKRKV